MSAILIVVPDRATSEGVERCVAAALPEAERVIATSVSSAIIGLRRRDLIGAVVDLVMHDSTMRSVAAHARMVHGDAFPIVTLGENETEGTRLAVEAVGSSAHFSRPFDAPELVEAFRRVFGTAE